MRSIFLMIEKRLIGPHYRLSIAKEDAIFSTGNEGTKLFRKTTCQRLKLTRVGNFSFSLPPSLEKFTGNYH